MKGHDKSGFAIIELLLAVVLLACIAVIGYSVWKTNQSNKKTDDLKVSQSTPASAIKTFADCQKAAGSKILTTYPEQCVTKDGKSFTDISQSTTKYLTIKEWGVRASYAGSLNLEYGVLKSATNTVALNSDQLSAAGCRVDLTQVGGPAGDIVRAKAIDQAPGGESGQTAAQYAATQDKTDYGHVGEYYYFYESPGGPCSGSSSAAAIQKQTQDVVKGLLPNLQTAPAN